MARSVVCRPADHDDRHAARDVSVCRHSVVQHAVRPRRHHHRVRAAVAESGRRARRAHVPRRRRRPRLPTMRRMRSPARSCTRCAGARWPRSARCRSGATTAAATPRRCSSCSPHAYYRADRRPARSSTRSGRTCVAALEWMHTSGDLDGDGFIEYARQSDTGLVQQGWKDSHDSVFHADGSAADAADRAVRGAGLRVRGVEGRGASSPSLRGDTVSAGDWMATRRAVARASSSARSGATSSARMRSRSTATSGRAACGPPTRATACLQASSRRSAPSACAPR